MDGDTPEHVDLALDEARRTLDSQQEFVRSIEEAMRDLVKIDLLLGSIVVAVIQIAPGEIPPLTLSFWVSSLLLIALSAGIALRAQYLSNINFGINKEGIEAVANGTVSKDAVVTTVAVAVEDNKQYLHDTADSYGKSVAATISAILIQLLGVAAAIL